MKVLIINGSPRKEGNTDIALKEMVNVFEEEKIETELIQIGNKDIRGCTACGYCFEKGKCVFKDLVNEVAPKFEEGATATLYKDGVETVAELTSEKLIYGPNTIHKKT